MIIYLQKLIGGTGGSKNQSCVYRLCHSLIAAALSVRLLQRYTLGTGYEFVHVLRRLTVGRNSMYCGSHYRHCYRTVAQRRLHTQT